jgi:hypothetical protein
MTVLLGLALFAAGFLVLRFRHSWATWFLPTDPKYDAGTDSLMRRVVPSWLAIGGWTLMIAGSVMIVVGLTSALVGE